MYECSGPKIQPIYFYALYVFWQSLYCYNFKYLGFCIFITRVFFDTSWQVRIFVVFGGTKIHMHKIVPFTGLQCVYRFIFNSINQLRTIFGQFLTYEKKHSVNKARLNMRINRVSS